MSSELERVVRILGTDLDGSRKLIHGLSMIKGLGPNLANAVVSVAKLDPGMRVGNLSEKEVRRLEEIIREPVKHGVPSWLVNRSRDRVTGEDRHLIGSDLTLQTKMDTDLLRKIGIRRGVRYSLGLKVRGQRTKTTGRRGIAVGVRRKKLMRRARE
ncbi:MAG: 30S ribosomal protein S13 [Candidatus Bathyarchaeia archaeon]